MQLLLLSSVFPLCLFSTILLVWFLPYFSFHLLFGGSGNLNIPWFSLHVQLFFFPFFSFSLCLPAWLLCLQFCLHLCLFRFFSLHCLFPLYLILFLFICVLFLCNSSSDALHFSSACVLPSTPVLLLPRECHFPSFQPILFPHTPVKETQHGYIKAGQSLFQTGRA